jgi:hypothetical protein
MVHIRYIGIRILHSIADLASTGSIRIINLIEVFIRDLFGNDNLLCLELGASPEEETC